MMISSQLVAFCFHFFKGKRREVERKRRVEWGKRKKIERKNKANDEDGRQQVFLLSCFFPSRRAAPHSVPPRPRKRHIQALFILKCTSVVLRGTKGGLRRPRGKNIFSPRPLATPSPPTKREEEEEEKDLSSPPPPHLCRLGLRANTLALEDEVRGGGARLEVGGERRDLERHVFFFFWLGLKGKRGRRRRRKKREL